MSGERATRLGVAVGQAHPTDHPLKEKFDLLLASDLVDAMSIFTVPAVLRGGKKLFEDGSAPHSYKLTRSRASSMGVGIAHYERGGEIKIVDAALAERSNAEAAPSRPSGRTIPRLRHPSP
jgi:hypothetical protein